MAKRFYERYNVDEDTPVQFVGVYTTHWRSEWGEPEVMFAETSDPLISNALQVLEALKAAQCFNLSPMFDAKATYTGCKAKEWRRIKMQINAAIAAISEEE